MFISKTNMFMFPIIGWQCISRVSFLYSMYGQQEPVGMTIASTYNLVIEQDFYITCVTGFFFG
jgi:hypothetical protein